jgi:hypothetical protein
MMRAIDTAERNADCALMEAYRMVTVVAQRAHSLSSEGGVFHEQRRI